MDKQESATAALTRTVDAKLKLPFPVRRRTIAMTTSSDRPMIDPSSAPSVARTQPHSGTPKREQSPRQAPLALKNRAAKACMPQEGIRSPRPRDAPPEAASVWPFKHFQSERWLKRRTEFFLLLRAAHAQVFFSRLQFQPRDGLIPNQLKIEP
jgi:hypothetical protein